MSAFGGKADIAVYDYLLVQNVSSRCH